MLQFLLGVAVGATLANLAGRAYRERENEHLVAEITRLHAHDDHRQGGI